MATLKRVLSGVVLIPVVILSLFHAPAPVFAALVAGVVLLGLVEFNYMGVFKAGPSASRLAGVAFGVLVPIAFYFKGEAGALAVVIAATFCIFGLAMTDAKDMKGSVVGACYRIAGVVYIGLPLSYIMLIRDLDAGPWWTIYVFAVIWSNDTFAYVAGRAIGSRKLSSVISPKKTVEGLVAGLVSGVVVSILFVAFAPMSLGYVEGAVLSVVIGAVGVVGDLIESLVKRGAGVKDSGSLIPGHGGMLDRMDSLVFTMPLLYYYLAWFS